MCLILFFKNTSYLGNLFPRTIKAIANISIILESPLTALILEAVAVLKSVKKRNSD